MKKLLSYFYPGEQFAPHHNWYLLLTCALVFLLPYLGWIPLLSLWLLNFCAYCYANQDNRSKYFYGAMILLFALLLLLNVCMTLSAFS